MSTTSPIPRSPPNAKPSESVARDRPPITKIGTNAVGQREAGIVMAATPHRHLERLALRDRQRRDNVIIACASDDGRRTMTAFQMPAAFS